MNKTTATQNGFTLVETLASIVLLVIILLSFTQLFVQTNKAANINNEKLVVINLADGILEGLKAKPMKEIKAARKHLKICYHFKRIYITFSLMIEGRDE